MFEAEVISIKREGFFTKAQADSLVSVIYKITHKYRVEVEAVIAEIDRVTSDAPILIELEEKMNSLIQDWHHKVKKLGAVPKGLWLVDFDNGSGYYCWKYPEKIVEFSHDYDGQFKNRKKIVDSNILTL